VWVVGLDGVLGWMGRLVGRKLGGMDYYTGFRFGSRGVWLSIYLILPALAKKLGFGSWLVGRQGGIIELCR